MADPGQLPPAVYQGLGWSPAADPTQAMPVPMPPDGPDFSALPPSIVQGMGWTPPPDTSAPPPPELPQAPTSLPSMQGQPAATSPASGATPDYQVPASAFGRGQGAAPPGSPPGAAARAPAPAPGRPQTFDQRMGALEQREAGTEQAQNAAIQANVEAQKSTNALEGEAYRKADETVAANAAARKTEQEQWDKIYATNTAQVDADRKQIESWKFNRNSYMDGLGVGDKVRWGIATILSNVGRALQHQTGPDPIAEMLQQNIHDANEAQFKERDALVQKLGIDRQSGMDAQQYHATRQAEIDKADGLAYTALSQQLKEAAVKTGDQSAQAAGMKAAADVKAAADTKFSSNIQLRSQHDLQQQQVGIAGGELALNRKKFEWEQNKDQQKLDIEAAALLAKKQGKLSDEESKRALFIPGPDGKPIVARDQAGNPVLSAEAGKDRDVLAATETYNALTNSMIRGIKDHGGESDFWHSADWQRMQSDYNAAIVELHKAYGVESFRGEWTADMFKKIASAGMDPTGFNWIRENAIPGLQQSNQNVQLKANSLLHKNGYDGPSVQWQDTSSPPVPTQTEEQKIASDAMLNPLRGFDKRPGKLATELGNFSSRGQLGPDETVDTRLKQEGGIMPSVRQAMQTWGAALNSPDLAIRRHYYQQLEKIAQDSESPETAALAQKLLDSAQAQQIGATPGTPEVVRGSAGAPR
jgi:hypothetical protein